MGWLASAIAISGAASAAPLVLRPSQSNWGRCHRQGPGLNVNGINSGL